MTTRSDASQVGSDAGTDAGADAAPPVDPFEVGYQEVYDRGLLKYVGTPEVAESSVTSPVLAPNIDVHHFSTEGRGPLCMRGDEFFVETRDGSTDDLLLFLEGGGVCLDEICAATSKPMINLRLLTLGGVIGIGGLLDKNQSRNPMADFDLVHAPYCDGAIFLGDVDRPLSDGNPKNGTADPAYQRGLLNITAALDVASKTYPHPRRIVLAGTSGGSYGTLLGVALVRAHYPDVPILLVTDSGAPILRSDDPDFIRRVLVQLNAIDLIPDSCPDCITDGHVRGFLAWALAHDRNLTVAYMTHSHDHVIGEFFMQQTPEAYAADILKETDELVAAFPTRFRRFVLPGDAHMMLLDGDTLPDGLQRSVMSLVGTAVFTGDQATAEELGKWYLGGLRETGTTTGGADFTGYTWLESLLGDFVSTPSIVNVN